MKPKKAENEKSAIPGSGIPKPEAPKPAPEFNKLSYASQAKLQAAALMGEITGIVRDDTREHPWRYPLYVTYMAGISLGFGGIWVIQAGATIAVIKLAPTKWTRWADKRLSNAFNEESLNKMIRETHKDCIGEFSDHPGTYYVKSWELSREVSKQSFADSREATADAANAFIGLFKRKPGGPGPV